MKNAQPKIGKGLLMRACNLYIYIYINLYIYGWKPLTTLKAALLVQQVQQGRWHTVFSLLYKGEIDGRPGPEPDPQKPLVLL